jgi:hypothetical protein
MSDSFALKCALLVAQLQTTVPFVMLDLYKQGGPLTYEWRFAYEFSQVLAEKGDMLLFADGKRGTTAKMMGDLSRVAAILAFTPGGITLCDEHFDAGVPDKHGVIHCIAPGCCKAWFEQYDARSRT